MPPSRLLFLCVNHGFRIIWVTTQCQEGGIEGWEGGQQGRRPW